MVVTGVLPRRHVEVVTWARVREALGTIRDLDGDEAAAGISDSNSDDPFGFGR